MVRSLALVRSCLRRFLFVPTFLSSRFIATPLHYSCVCFFLLLHLRCFHARGILCEIHTLCIGSPFFLNIFLTCSVPLEIRINFFITTSTTRDLPFPILHAEWSLVFWYFRIMLCRVEEDCFKLTNNNHYNITSPFFLDQSSINLSFVVVFFFLSTQQNTKVFDENCITRLLSLGSVSIVSFNIIWWCLDVYT